MNKVFRIVTEELVKYIPPSLNASEAFDYSTLGIKSKEVIVLLRPETNIEKYNEKIRKLILLYVERNILLRRKDIL